MAPFSSHAVACCIAHCEKFGAHLQHGHDEKVCVAKSRELRQEKQRHKIPGGVFRSSDGVIHERCCHPACKRINYAVRVIGYAPVAMIPAKHTHAITKSNTRVTGEAPACHVCVATPSESLAHPNRCVTFRRHRIVTFTTTTTHAA